VKPLLAVPELLPEDAHAWSVVTFWAETKYFQLGSRLFASSIYADRRDAELMSALVRVKYFLLAKGCPLEAIREACRVDVERIAAGGVTG
jgi:hypothetical protein